jgi:dextranase
MARHTLGKWLRHVLAVMAVLVPIPTLHGQIVDVFPDKARYHPETDANLFVELHHGGSQPVSGTLRVTVRRLAEIVGEFTREVTLSAGETRSESFTWTTRGDQYRGYGVDADFLIDGNPVSSRSSAIDVSQDFIPFPRYGYYTDFHPGQPYERLDWEVDNLSKHHINVIQYYDWMWTHDRLIPYENGEPVGQYEDFFGSLKNLDNIRRKIQRGHERGMEAMAYSLLYGDSGNDAGPERIEWASFTGPWKTQPADVRNHIGKIWVMDASNEEWQSHIFGEFRNAMTELDFDGIHLDNLGGASSYQYDSENVIPEDIAFPSFINDCKSEIRAQRPFAKLAHNDVAGGHLGAVAPAQTDFYYAEVWGRERFIDVRNLILDAKAAGGRDKAVVLAAYMNYHEFLGENPPEWINEASVRLMNACVAANGAFHLELGDGDRMLTNEFFPVHRPMHDSLKRGMRDHYSFIVRYENFLFFNNQGGVRDGTDEMRISSDTHGLSKDGSAGKIWTVARIWEGEFDSVSLINLNGTDEQWRNVSGNPEAQSDIHLKYYMDRKCRGIFVATPDDGLGRPHEVPFTEGNDDGGYFVELTVPSLQWWDLLIFDKTARIKTDGWPGDWRGLVPDAIHGMTVNAGEFIYRGDSGDTRSFTGVTEDSDITEVRATADETYLHFLIRMRDITDERIPAIGMAIDTDQDPHDTGHIWIGDASTPEGSILLADPVQYAERQVMIYSEGGRARIKLWDGGEWHDPPSGVAAVSINAEFDCIEASVPKADLGIVAPRRVKLTLASFRSSGNAAGNNSTFDSDHHNNDAIDVMGGTPGVPGDSWERDLSDNAIGHHATFLVDTDRVSPVLVFTGHGRHTPAVPAALSTLMVEVETFPREAAGSASVGWRVNAGEWQDFPMNHAGQSTELGINDLWRIGIGSFQPGDVVEYHFRSRMADGTSMLDDNGGVNYRAVVPVDGDGDGLPDAWELLHGLSISSATGDNGAKGDPDKDGIVNLLEVAFGGNPKAPDAGVLPRTEVIDGRFRIIFNRDLTAGLTLTVQASETPDGPWQSLARGMHAEPLESIKEEVNVLESGDGSCREVEVSVPLGNQRAFMRVKVEP